jgi:KaiC/GvpD/RAD55 family RecA-like ATPase
LLDQLISGGIESGTVFTVEFDPDSQWYAVAATIAVKYLQAGGRVSYVAVTRPPDAVKRELIKVGLDVAATVKEGRLNVDDWYTATLSGGRIATEQEKAVVEPIDGGMRLRSVKVADISVEWLRLSKQGPRPFDVTETWPPGALTILDSASELMRFNEESVYLEFVITRAFPNERKSKRIRLGGIARGVHSDPFYKRMEAASDGIIDLRVMERDDEAKNLIRVRSLKGQRHDARWHEIEIGENGEALLKN